MSGVGGVVSLGVEVDVVGLMGGGKNFSVEIVPGRPIEANLSGIC